MSHRTPDLPKNAESPVAFPNGAIYGALSEGQSGISGAVTVAAPAVTGAMDQAPKRRPGLRREGARAAFYNDLSTEDYLGFAAYLNPAAGRRALDEALETSRLGPRNGPQLPRSQAEDSHV